MPANGRKHLATTSKAQPGSSRAVLKTRQGKVRLRSFDELDQRFAATQKAKSLVRMLEADLGGDPSTAQRQLAQRGALLAAMLEDLETRWVSGEAIELQEYGFLANTQRRILASLGLERKARDVTPDRDDEGSDAALDSLYADIGKLKQARLKPREEAEDASAS